MTARCTMSRAHAARPSAALLAGVCLACIGGGAVAQTVPLETIVVNGKRTGDAAAIAPSSTPLDAVQPTSVITGDFLTKNLPLTGNYDEAIKFSPSVFDTAPNGPGLAESQNISIRGFQDGQFNVTFDGIPWGDSNDFTHHTTSFFKSHDFGQVSVDRGPGTAATIGNATFGGTVHILSKAPDEELSIRPYGSYGSFNTATAGLEIDTGAIGNGTRLLLDGEAATSDGYLTYLGQSRQNLFFKAVQPVGPDSTLTFAASYNHLKQNISLGATRPQITAFGPNYGLSADPTNQNYYGYNKDYITSDFEYVDFASHWGDWSLDTKLYTYAYFHTGLNGEDPNGEYSHPPIINVGGVPTLQPNGVPGQFLTNDYRSFGTITRLTRDFKFGDVKAGFWYDNQVNQRRLLEVDYSAPGHPLNLDDANTGGINGVDRDLHQVLRTFQPYVQLDLNLFSGFTFTPGFRYSYFERKVEAVVNVKDGQADNYTNKFDAYLPSFEAHYKIMPNWTAYGQAAEGFLAPNENFFNRSTAAATPGSPNVPATTTLAPQKTWNYQIGTAVSTKRLALSLDGYIIDFSNLITGVPQGGQVNFINLGGVTYKGIEAEGTYKLGYGVSVYANGTLNRATLQADGTYIANAPKSTAAGGVIYSAHGLYGSILAKYIGARYGDVNQQQHLSPIVTADLSLGYDAGRITDYLKGATLKINVQNLFDNTKIINLAGYTVGQGNALYWTQPGRSAFVSLEFKL